jgi:hypothetical protein
MVRTGVAVAVFAGSAVIVVPALAAQVVVIDASESIAKTMAPGTVIDDASVDLPAGADLTVMGADGEAVHIVGPHKGAIGAAAPGSTAGNAVQALATLLNGSQRSSAFGATRGGVRFGHGDDTKPKNPWVIDATEGGTACVFASHPAQLWKPAGAAARISVDDEATHQHAIVDWPENATTVAWPTDFAPADGVRYTVTFGAETHRSITLKLLPAASTPGAAALMAANAGCVEQSKLLLQTVTPSRTVSPT